MSLCVSSFVPCLVIHTFPSEWTANSLVGEGIILPITLFIALSIRVLKIMISIQNPSVELNFFKNYSSWVSGSLFKALIPFP